MSTMEIAMFLAPLVVGFGVGYLSNRRHGESPQQAFVDALTEMFEKYVGKPEPADAPSPDVNVNPPLIDVIHKLIDKLGEKK
jgi:hypothetical protein